MLYRKLESKIRKFLIESPDKILIVSGARQVGKSYLIRYVGKSLFRNFIEINLVEDKATNRLFENIQSADEMYVAISAMAKGNLGTAEDTLIFLDEIQEYPQLLTLLKFLLAEKRYRFICSGSLLGVTLRHTTSIPIGTIEVMQMYPLDLEEFLIANNLGTEAIESIRTSFQNLESLSEGLHNRVMDIFRRYLLVGGLPQAVNEFLVTRNIVRVRAVQKAIHDLYAEDAARYDQENRLNIKRMYDLIPSNMENVKKRMVFSEIEYKKGARSKDYLEDVEYLISSGIALEVKAISNPKFPLIETESKNLIKLYLNDVGMLTGILYRNNVVPVLKDIESINLGAVYESVVAMELASKSNRLFYYDNRSRGEVDYLIDDFEELSVLPIEVKSGKDYKRHSALSRFVSTPDYHINRGYVLSNSRQIEIKDKIIYLPIYYVMWFSFSGADREEILI